MNPQTFLKEFSAIANAPGGLQRVREMILQLAVQGKLVEQDSMEEPADELLLKIQEKKRARPGDKRVIRLEKIATNKNQTTPAGWVNCLLGDIVLTITGGGTPSKNNPAYWNGNIPWASVKDLKENKYLEATQDLISHEGLENSASHLIPPGRYIVCTRMGLGKSAINRIETAINQDLKALEIPSEVNIDFFHILFRTRIVIGTGMTVKGIKQSELLTLPAILPPLNEQKRIVEKVDQLMALCDQLEAQQQKRSKLIKNARVSALEALANSQAGKELQIAWNRVKENLPQLFETPEDIEDLRKTLKNVAVNGNLIPVYSKPELTGQNLLDEITKERKKWELSSEGQELKEAKTMAKKLKKQNLTFPKTKIPNHWVWASFLQIAKAVVDCHNKTAPYVESGIHLVRTTDIRNGVMNLQFTKKITSKTYDFWSRRMPPVSGDIFFTREAPMGEAAVVPEEETVCLGQRTMLIRLFPNLFERDFLLFAVYSPSFIERMEKSGIGATVKHLRVGDAENLMLPVPPLAEQKVIVEKLKLLIVLCDTLQNQLKKSRKIAEQLAQSVVESITGITTEKQEKMKAPKTELITKLKLINKPDVNDHAPLSALLVKNNDELSAKVLWNHSGLPIDKFYHQLKIEMVKGWIEEPQKAVVRIIEEKDTPS